MQAPPYASMPPKKTNVGLIVGVIIAALCICCVLPAGIGTYLGMGIFNKAKGFMGCGWSLEQMRDGLVAYAKAHGGKLPGKDKWQDDIAPYLKPLPNNQGIPPPPMNGDVCDVDAGSSATYNAAFAGKKASSITDPSSAVILWETAGRGRNKSAPFKEPEYSTGPKLVGNIPRGWMIQPLSGEAHYVSNPQGLQQTVPYPGNSGSVSVDISDKNGKVDVKTGDGKTEVKTGD